MGADLRVFPGILSCCVVVIAAALWAPTPVSANETAIMVDGRSVGRSVDLSTNRARVIETDRAFSEVSIANPDIADIDTISEQAIYVLGNAPGRTTLSIVFDNGETVRNIDVHVTPDVSELRERLSEILPSEPIEVRTASDGVVLSGVVSSTATLDRALKLAEQYAPERVSNMMSVGGKQQVMLQVRFAEMSRSVSKGLGLPSGGFSGAGSVRGDFNGGSTITGGLEFSILLEALEERNLVRTLAEPNLVALTGQEAQFLAGGELPVPVSDEDGVTVEFKPFGVELNFTPFVVDGDVINLSINAAVSGIDPTVGITAGGISIDGFNRRETSTTVEMRDGESFAIAGLLQDDFRTSIDQMPGLADIPILGALFRSTSYQREQSELVIMVTPRLVTPTRRDALAMPTDRVRPPSERDLFLYGRSSEELMPGAVGELQRQEFGGAHGYVMD